MNDELENQLRRALRPVEAPPGFTERLMSRLPAPADPAKPVVVTLPVAPVRRAHRFALPAALAASLLAAVMLGQQMAHWMQTNQEERELAEGRAASRELLEALRVASQKLDLAYQAVNNPPRSSTPGEENPS